MIGLDFTKWFLAQHESQGDRAVRFVIGMVLLALWVFGPSMGLLGYVVVFIGLVGVFTAMTGHCAIYPLLDINTKLMFGGERKAVKPAAKKRGKKR